MSLNKILGLISLTIVNAFVVLGISVLASQSGNLVIEKLFTGLYTVLQLLGIAFLLLTTKIKDNHRRKLVRLGDMLVIVGAGMIILHLPEIVGFSLLSAGLLVILIDQILRLKLLKNDLLLIEGMKIAWYFFFWTGVIFKGLHLHGAQILLFISVVVLWLAISGYVFKKGLPKYIN